MPGKRQSIFLCTALFTLYTFAFLLAELTVNARCGAVLGPPYVVFVYAAGIVCTSAGYLAFSVFSRLFPGDKADRGLVCVLSGGFLGFALCFLFTPSPAWFTASALAALLAFGYMGGYVHWAAALLLAGTGYSGRVIGASVALATLLQFAVQNLPLPGAAVFASLCLGAGGLVLLILGPLGGRLAPPSAPRPAGGSAPFAGLALPLVIVAAMSVCFGLGDGLVTRLDAGGVVNLASWGRLLYALSALAAGAVADIRRRRFLPLCTLFLLVLTAALTLFIGSDNTAANSVYICGMYVFSGFYIMYITLTFIDAAPKTACPRLWAGAGRMVRGVCIGATAVLSGPLFAGTGRQGIAIGGICCSLVVLVLFFLSGALSPGGEKQAGAEDRMEAFLSRYPLTPREAEVLALLVEADATNADIARALYISVRVAERYLTSIYGKTGTHSRAGLVRLYYSQ